VLASQVKSVTGIAAVNATISMPRAMTAYFTFSDGHCDVADPNSELVGLSFVDLLYAVPVGLPPGGDPR
jgi:hypothetical protein